MVFSFICNLFRRAENTRDFTTVGKDFNAVNVEYFSPKFNGNDNHGVNIEEKPKINDMFLDISKFQSGSSYA